MKALFIALAVICGLAFFTQLTVAIVWDIQFDRNCEGYLKRAADSNTVDLAIVQLEKAIKYLEDNNMTTGYTSVVYNTPDEDVGFLYTNLTKSLAELKSLPANATTLEKSNTLIKLRETLLDGGVKGVYVTLPSGISRFPHNTVMVVLCGLSMMLTILFLLAAVVCEDY